MTDETTTVTIDLLSSSIVTTSPAIETTEPIPSASADSIPSASAEPSPAAVEGSDDVDDPQAHERALALGNVCYQRYLEDAIADARCGRLSSLLMPLKLQFMHCQYEGPSPKEDPRDLAELIQTLETGCAGVNGEFELSLPRAQAFFADIAVACAPQVTTLTLTGSSSWFHGVAPDTFHALVARGVRFPRLEFFNMNLFQCLTRPEDVLSFLRAHRETLRSLRLFGPDLNLPLIKALLEGGLGDVLRDLPLLELLEMDAFIWNKAARQDPNPLLPLPTTLRVLAIPVFSPEDGLLDVDADIVPAVPADRVPASLQRLYLYDTPVHSSWLDRAKESLRDYTAELPDCATWLSSSCSNVLASHFARPIKITGLCMTEVGRELLEPPRPRHARDREQMDCPWRPRGFSSAVPPETIREENPEDAVPLTTSEAYRRYASTVKQHREEILRIIRASRCVELHEGLGDTFPWLFLGDCDDGLDFLEIREVNVGSAPGAMMTRPLRHLSVRLESITQLDYLKKVIALHPELVCLNILVLTTFTKHWRRKLVKMLSRHPGITRFELCGMHPKWGLRVVTAANAARRERHKQGTDPSTCARLTDIGYAESLHSTQSLFGPLARKNMVGSAYMLE